MLLPTGSRANMFTGRCHHQCCALLFRREYVHHVALRALCVPRGVCFNPRYYIESNLRPSQVIEQYFYSREAYNHQRHLFLTTAILFTSTMSTDTFLNSPCQYSQPLTVSLFTCDLGVMLEITGGVSATALAYIFPAACYYTLIDPKPPWYSRSKLPSVTCVGFGVVVLCISLWLALAKTWTTEGDARMCI